MIFYQLSRSPSV